MYQTNSILLVEEDAAIQAFIVEVLHDEGYTVRAVADVPGALDVLATYQPNLILLDLGVPERTGAALLEHLRQDAHSAPPVVLMTTRPYDAEDGPGHNVVDYLIKPFELEDLLACVARYARADGRGKASS